MYAAAIAAAAASAPMGGAVPVAHRVLLVDGDGLAYYCAGNDDTGAGEARAKLIEKVRSAQRVCGAERVIILLTGSGSPKGHRYAVARVKPYQGQRVNSRRPKNWQALRELMEGKDLPFDVETTYTAEADDLFAERAYKEPHNTVIYTQDKDMRMLPGMHLDWVSHRIHTVAWMPGTHHSDPWKALSSESNDKQYGPKWFWLQMLHGDTADYIPGLPKYVPTGTDKLKPVGEVTAGKLLVGATEYATCVAYWYKSFYKDRWLVEMLEQAVLLWLRRVPDKWDDCLDPGGPLHCFNDGSVEFMQAYAEIQERVRNADDINTATTQDN